jgi:hypothetical protein
MAEQAGEPLLEFPGRGLDGRALAAGNVMGGEAGVALLPFGLDRPVALPQIIARFGARLGGRQRDEQKGQQNIDLPHRHPLTMAIIIRR